MGSAVLFGLTGDLSLSVVDTSTNPPSTVASRLSWAISIFYFGMLAGLYPYSHTAYELFQQNLFSLSRFGNLTPCIFEQTARIHSCKLEIHNVGLPRYTTKENMLTEMFIRALPPR